MQRPLVCGDSTLDGRGRAAPRTGGEPFLYILSRLWSNPVTCPGAKAMFLLPCDTRYFFASAHTRERHAESTKSETDNLVWLQDQCVPMT